MAGVSVRKFYSKSQPILGQDRGRGEAPLHFLVDSFGGGGRQRRHFRGCCTGGKKCVNLQVIVPGRFGARKMTQENILGDIRTRQNAQ